MPEPAISYTPRPDATPEAEISALANVYRLIIDSAKKKAAPESRPEAAMKGSNNDRDYTHHCT